MTPPPFPFPLFPLPLLKTPFPFTPLHEQKWGLLSVSKSLQGLKGFFGEWGNCFFLASLGKLAYFLRIDTGIITVKKSVY
jgi:hypothetical protein